MGTADRTTSKPNLDRGKNHNTLRSNLRDMAFPMRALKPKTVVGIDIGSGAIKAVRLAVGNGEYRVLDWSIRVSSPAHRTGKQDTIRRAVMEALSDVGGPGDHLAINLSGPEARIHQVHLPEIPGKDLARAVEWQVQKDLGGETTDARVAFTVLRRMSDIPDKPLEILAASVPQSTLNGLFDVLGQLRVHGVGTTALSYGNLLSIIPEGKTHRGFAVVDVGGDGTWICIFRRGAMIYARRVGVAGNLFTQALTQPVQTPDGPLRYSAEEAEEAKRNKVLNLTDPAGPGKTPDYFSVLVRPAVERLSAEVERTLVHFVNASSGEPIERVYLAGGGSLIGGLPEAMSARLGLPVERLDLGKIPASESKPMGEHALCLAAAIGAALGWASDINLIPVSRRMTRSTALGLAVLFWVATALMVSVPALTCITGVTAGRLSADLARARAGFKSVGAQQARLSQINESRSRVESKQGLVSLLPGERTIAPQILKDLPHRLPKGVILNSLRLDHESVGLESDVEVPARQILVSGEVHGRAEGLEATLLDFLLKIRESPFYDAPVVVRKERIFRGEESALAFEIVCVLN